jgi:hypothetical protein
VFYCAGGIAFALREPYDYALPYLRFGIVVIALFLVARILLVLTLKVSAEAAKLAAMPYQRGQFWVRRFRQPAEKLCVALAALIAPRAALDFASRVLQMLESIGWIAAHRFLFADVRVHLLGWPAFLARTVASPRCRRRHRPPELEHTAFAWRSRTARPYALAVEVIRMDAKAEKVALFR